MSTKQKADNRHKFIEFANSPHVQPVLEELIRCVYIPEQLLGKTEYETVTMAARYDGERALAEKFKNRINDVLSGKQ